MTETDGKQIMTIKKLYSSWKKEDFSIQPRVEELDYLDGQCDVHLRVQNHQVYMQGNSVMLGAVYKFFAGLNEHEWHDQKNVAFKMTPRVLGYIILYAHFKDVLTFEKADYEDVIGLLAASDYLQSHKLFNIVQTRLIKRALHPRSEAMTLFKETFTMTKAALCFWSTLIEELRTRREEHYRSEPLEVFVRSNSWKWCGLESGSPLYEEMAEIGIKKTARRNGKAVLSKPLEVDEYIEFLMHFHSDDWCFEFGQYNFNARTHGVLQDEDFVVFELSDTGLKFYKNGNMVSETKVDNVSGKLDGS